MTAALVTVALLTLLLSLVLPFAVKPLLARLNIIDVPNERSSHFQPVIRGLGLATLLAMIGGYLAALLLFSDEAGLVLVVVASVAAAASLVGLLEDVRGLPVMIRSLLQLGIAAAAVISFVVLDGAWWVWIPYGILFLSSYINVANFMDGINGISGMHGVIAGLTFTVAGILADQPWLAFAGVVLAAAFLGFLPWNLFGSGAFLGDVGSYLLGGAVAATAIAAAIGGVPWLATIGPMILYFGDVAYTLVKRVRGGAKWYEPHKEHVYERINQLGYSHGQVTLIVSTLTALASVLGIASFWATGIVWWMLLAAGLALTGLYLALPRILPVRHARVA
jgi:UDP-N-acetylmuramyl pentapeptide phosphotransferase/UDP-N-acetylglucosamine-1-phosphate transferase